MIMSWVRLAAAGVIALLLSSAFSVASAGCVFGCGYVVIGHYPTINPPAGLYYPPPSSIVRVYEAPPIYVSAPVIHEHVTYAPRFYGPVTLVQNMRRVRHW
jgi:hypothetical protein